MLIGGDNGGALEGGGGDGVLHADSPGNSADRSSFYVFRAGADALKGGPGSDTAGYYRAPGAVRADLSNPSTNTGEAQGDRYRDIENLFGSEYADRPIGDDGVNAFRGAGGSDIIEGGGGNDTIYGDGDYDDNDGVDNDILDGGAGDDEPIGGGGGDTYKFGRGGGSDTIDNRGGGASDDLAPFGAGIDADRLWFEQTGVARRDLEVSIVGTDDSVVIEDWYNGAGNTLDFGLSDGRRLVAADVQRLVQAMSTMVEPGADATEWSADQHTTLDPLVAAHWRQPPQGGS